VRYVTRETLHIDRIATAWAIGRFVDPQASFVFVPRTKDIRGMAETPFDIRGASLSHRGERCTFEVLVEMHGLIDAALGRMGRIVRGADFADQLDSTRESAGLRAISDGFPLVARDDQDTVERASFLYDALYAALRARLAKDT